MKVICIDTDGYPLKLGAEFEGELVPAYSEMQELIWEI